MWPHWDHTAVRPVLPNRACGGEGRWREGGGRERERLKAGENDGCAMVMKRRQRRNDVTTEQQAAAAAAASQGCYTPINAGPDSTCSGLLFSTV